MIVPGRRVGNTTRIVDSLVQDYFTIGEFICADHYYTDDGRVMLSLSKMIFDKVATRLQSEHRIRLSKDGIKIKDNLVCYKEPKTQQP